MRLLFSAMAMMASLASASLAKEPSELRSLLTSNDSRGWEAVGRVNIAGRQMCTGALIAPDLVLTAAHCLFDKTSKRRVDAARIEFLVGWRGGRALAYARIKRTVLHPEYTFATEPDSIRVRNDVALLQLVRPIRKTSVTPFQTGVRPRKGAIVGVVSYAHDRSESPSLQENCRVLARQSGTLIMSCEADFGTSGAPVFTIKDGVARIVSVVSAMAEVDGRKVSLGMSLEEPLAVLKARLLEAEVPVEMPGANPRRIMLHNNLDHTGAKFVRP